MTLHLSLIQDNVALQSELKNVDISVPGRSEGRSKHHTETWTACHLLSTLSSYNDLSFPLSLEHHDRPDFLMRSTHSEIGIEITEAITKEFAAYCALAEREFPNAFVDPCHFRWGAPKLTVKEMRQLLQQDALTSDGWAGDYPEQEWAQFIGSTIDMKLGKLAKSGFKKFDQNWLSIYDNLPLPFINLERAVAHLKPLIEDLWKREPSFDVVFVEHGPVIVRLSVGGADHLILNDIW